MGESFGDSFGPLKQITHQSWKSGTPRFQMAIFFEGIWWFPEIGLPPESSSVARWDVPLQTIQLWGNPLDYGNPQIIHVQTSISKSSGTVASAQPIMSLPAAPKVSSNWLSKDPISSCGGEVGTGGVWKYGGKHGKSHKMPWWLQFLLRHPVCQWLVATESKSCSFVSKQILCQSCHSTLLVRFLSEKVGDLESSFSVDTQSLKMSKPKFGAVLINHIKRPYLV